MNILVPELCPAFKTNREDKRYNQSGWLMNVSRTLHIEKKERELFHMLCKYTTLGLLQNGCRKGGC